MIFAVGDHVEQIIRGTKTQTRRVAKSGEPRYELGRSYAIQRGRGKPAIPDGRIVITDIRLELWNDRISVEDAQAEGGYDPTMYEYLFSEMHPNWRSRYAYTFKFKPRRRIEVVVGDTRGEAMDYHKSALSDF